MMSLKVADRRQLLGLAASSTAVLMSQVVGAQPYPTRPVRIIVPFAPGGGTDIIVRPIAIQLSERLRRQFILDNRSGAGGVVGTEIAANAPKDGYTLLVITLSHAV